MSFPQYPKYKPSGVEWLGDVPEHWEICQFKQFVDIQNGADHKAIEQSEGYPVIGSGGVFAYASDFIYEGESILLGRKGTIDKPRYVNGPFWTVDTMYWSKIRPSISGRFTYFVALTISFDYYSTNTALPSMTKGVLNAHSVLRPPLAEQTQIAAFLDRETAKIDELVAEQRRLIELLKEKRQAVISHAVTKGLNPNAPTKPSGIQWLGDVPEHWGIIPLKQLCSLIKDGTHLPPPRVEIGIPLLSVRNLINGKFIRREDDSMISDDSYVELCRSFRPLPGDVLLAIVGATIGKTAIVPEGLGRFQIQRSLGVFRPKPDLALSRFINLVFESSGFQSLLWQLVGYSAQPGIYLVTLQNLRVAHPPQCEQIEIVAFLDAETAKLDALTAEAERAIELLQERRTALISAAVTGKIDVRNVGIKE
jgi:type I restriction enzyme S subunit